MAMEAALGTQSLVTKQGGPLAACHIHSSSQSTWRRGSAPSPSLNTFKKLSVSQGYDLKRCTPRCAIFNSKSSKQKPVSTQVANAPAPNDLARRWREIQGSNDWKGLLDPLDRTLREEILRYGEFTQATYDAFDKDDHSKYCGSARYNKAKMFEKVGLYKTGYEVTRYVYATANVDLPFFFKKPPQKDNETWSKDSNWMGYVAVCKDEQKVKQLGRRDIMIAWRGTIRNSEWAANFKRGLAPAAMDKRPNGGSSQVGKIQVETGFLALYTSKNPNTRYNKSSARTQVLAELKRLLDLYKGEQLSITITGHSLGSALATLNAYDIAQSGLNQPSRHVPIPTDWNKPTAPPRGPRPPRHHPRHSVLLRRPSRGQRRIPRPHRRARRQSPPPGERERLRTASPRPPRQRKRNVPRKTRRHVPVHVHSRRHRAQAQQPGLAVPGPGPRQQGQRPQPGAVPAPDRRPPRHGNAVRAHHRAPDCAGEQELQFSQDAAPGSGVLVAAGEQGPGHDAGPAAVGAARPRLRGHSHRRRRLQLESPHLRYICTFSITARMRSGFRLVSQALQQRRSAIGKMEVVCSVPLTWVQLSFSTGFEFLNQT